jgi:Flp pilus assembly protein TadD
MWLLVDNIYLLCNHMLLPEIHLMFSSRNALPIRVLAFAILTSTASLAYADSGTEGYDISQSPIEATATTQLKDFSQPAQIAPTYRLKQPQQPLYPSRAGANIPAMPSYEALTASAPALEAVPSNIPAPQVITSAIPTPDQASPAPQAAITLPAPPVDDLQSGQASQPQENAALPVILLPPPPAVKSDDPHLDELPAQEIASSSPMSDAAPIQAAVESAAPTAPELSSESRRILKNIRPQNERAKPSRSSNVDIKRISPEVEKIVKNATKAYESAGVSIRVSNTKLDVTSELQNAYTALISGETGTAIRIYQEILQHNPANEDGLFGLAATYHRTGQIENARSLYGQLLAQNPAHREGLNNFLMLIASESPHEALLELARLEETNPGYSPIPAQMGIIYDRLGEATMARDKILRAIELSPENWVYKYNLAIMLDRQKSYADAAAIYRDLIQASLQGEHLPMDMAALQARLNYIATLTTRSS